MQRYDSYKDSGVKWLGEIPGHWEVIKTSHLFTHIGSGTTPKSGSEEYYTEEGIPFLQTGDLNDGFIVDTSKKITEKALRDANLTIYPQGSLVIAMYGATIGKLGILDIDTTVNQACCVLPKSPKIKTKFAFYAYLAAKNDLIFQSKGGGQPNISQDTIKSERIPVPSRVEQDAIVTYLDTATAKIDAAIAQQQKMIDLLNERKQIIINRAVTKGLNPNAKMKDSGVEWIGEVPEGWNCRRLRFIGEANNGLTYSPLDMVDEGNGILVLRSSNIKDGKLVFEDNVYVKDVPQKLMVQKDDIIICSRNGSASLVGKCAIVEDELQASFGAFMMRFRSKYNSKYVYYLLTAAISHYKQLFATSTINQLTLGIFADIKMSITLDEDEQKCIAEKLDLICGKLDTYIGICNKQISLLQERKQIIINEVVTGKVKVTN